MSNLEVAARAFMLFALFAALAGILVRIGDWFDRLHRQRNRHVDDGPSSLCDRPGSISEFYRSYRGK